MPCIIPACLRTSRTAVLPSLTTLFGGIEDTDLAQLTEIQPAGDQGGEAACAKSAVNKPMSGAQLTEMVYVIRRPG
jgi:hypothetical protein